jgi:hypothetical protein
MLNIQSAATRFYEATAGTSGTNERQVQSILLTVANAGQQRAFDRAVQTTFREHRQPIHNTLEALEKEYTGNPLKRFFCQSQLKRMQDYYFTGQDQVRGTAWEYRKEGFWHVPEQLIQTIRTYPLRSTAIIGGILAAGYAFPVLAGLAGGTLITVSTLGFLKNEWQARKAGLSTEHRAAHWKKSGDHLCCLAMTLPGISGIAKSLRHGLEGAKQGFFSTQGSLGQKLLQGGKNGVTAKSHFPFEKPLGPTTHTDAISPLENGLVLTGLLDEALVPFSKLTQATQSPP